MNPPALVNVLQTNRAEWAALGQERENNKAVTKEVPARIT